VDAMVSCAHEIAWAGQLVSGREWRARRRARRAALLRTAKPCGLGAPTLASSLLAWSRGAQTGCEACNRGG
jgi:hypothetical protein